MFKPGDKVMCVNPIGGFLVKGQTYTVASLYSNASYRGKPMLNIEGVGNGIYCERFILVKEAEDIDRLLWE